MQPMWRIPRGKFWPLKRRSEEGERWASLMKGGPNGFVLVLISLVWWSKVAFEPGQWAKCEEMMVDVEWVLEQMVNELKKSAGGIIEEAPEAEGGEAGGSSVAPENPGKRVASEEAGENRPKRSAYATLLFRALAD